MKVFISFAQKDHHLVHVLNGALVENGIAPLVATNRLTPGARLDEKVKEMIRESDCVLVLNTPAASRSRWVQQEIGAAKALNKYIVPLKTRRAKPSAMLEGYEYFEFKSSSPAHDFNRVASFLIEYAEKHDIPISKAKNGVVSEDFKLLHLPHAVLCRKCNAVDNHVWLCYLCGDWVCAECGDTIPPTSRAASAAG